MDGNGGHYGINARLLLVQQQMHELVKADLMVAKKINLERIVSSEERQARLSYFVSLVHKEYWHEPNQTRWNHSGANCNLYLSFRKCMD